MAQKRVGVRLRPATHYNYSYNYGYQFDGVDEMITSSSSLNLTTDDAFSISYWFKRPINTSFSQDIVGQVSSSSNSNVKFGATSAFPYILIIADDNSRVDAKGTVRETGFNEWVHVLWTKNTGQDRSDLTLYVNGSLQSIAPIYQNNLNSGKNITCDTFFIGGRSVGVGGSSYFTGRIDDVQFYDFELNSTQVSDIYNSGYVTAPTASPIHNWKLGEEDTFSTDWTVKDSMGSLDGTSVNMEEQDRKLGVAYSMDFDGVDEYIDFGVINNFTSDSPRSVSFWVKMNVSRIQSLFGTWSQTNFKGWGVINVNGDFRFLIDEGPSASKNRLYVSSSLKPISGVWAHFVITYNGNELSSGVNFYKDKVLATTNVITENITSTNPLSGNDFIVGGNSNKSSYAYNGDQMYLSVFDSELSSSDISKLYNNGVPVDPRNVGLSPTFFAPLGGENDSFSTNWTIVDEINGNNGTSVNMEEADKTSDTP